MTSGLPDPFPWVQSVSEDRNPGIRLFGRRFVGDQSPLELLAEFLAVVLSDKQIKGIGGIPGTLPEDRHLALWAEQDPAYPLEYKPPVRLTLKLLALLSASRVDTRHPAHVAHYEVVSRRLAGRIQTSDGRQDEVVTCIEQLLRGYQGAGSNRAWCAQVLYPAVPEFLSKEAIWGVTKARKDGVDDWRSILDRFHTYFSISRRDFLARGGELLYLQLCNAFSVERTQLRTFVEMLRQHEPGCLSDDEASPERLHSMLERGLGRLDGQHAAGLSRLVEFIEDLDPETREAVGRAEGTTEGWLRCEWCPRDSWREGYLFAVELSRVLSAALDPMERLDMLMTGCALQVLRSLCAQSARYAAMTPVEAPLGYAWIMGPPNGDNRPLRQASQRNLQVIEALIYGALRHPLLQENASKSVKPTPDQLYREADSKYGHKLLRRLGKNMGLIVPRTGRGARFVMTDDMLRYLVAALLRPGERCTYDDLVERLRLHYGMTIEGKGLAEAAAWSGLPANRSIQPRGDWLATALRAGGFLVDLADGCAIVRNTYAPADGHSGGAG